LNKQRRELAASWGIKSFEEMYQTDCNSRFATRYEFCGELGSREKHDFWKTFEKLCCSSAPSR
jgi:hypothetical protein